MPKPIYLDYAATTPVDPAVIQKMRESLEQDFANAASQYFYGLAVSEHIETARQQIADCINAEPREIVFTSGATEANNLAIQGIARAYQDKGRHIITCQTEHKSVLGPCRYLEQQGFELSYLPVQKNGLIDMEQLRSSIKKDTILISIMQVNNEIGAVQNLSEIAQIAHQHNIIFHSDAAQSIGKLQVDVKALGIDALSLSSHKSYGPKGAGALYIKRPLIKLKPLMHGGGHEFGLRPGTLPTHQIIGMSEAFRIANTAFSEEHARIGRLKAMLWQGLKDLPGVSLNGDLTHSVPHILNLCFSTMNGEVLFSSLRPHLAVGSGAACDSAQSEPSHVLEALGLSRNLAESSIRFSLGRFTTEQDIYTAVQSIKNILL
ncbi:MAG: iscS [Gammaproteobacteria bacterium]|jgi:cysteine desulfurase|nr:iscS [Gammaproteobacteria bacterium]